MTTTDSKERDLMALVDAYAEARHIGGCHTYNAKTAEARAKVVASLAASAGSEPVARVNDDGFIVEIGDLPIAPGQKLYLHPSPPEGMVRGWMPIETAPKGELVLLWSSVKRGEPFIGDWADYMRCNQPRFTHWSRWIPTPPTTSAGSGKG